MGNHEWNFSSCKQIINLYWVAVMGLKLNCESDFLSYMCVCVYQIPILGLIYIIPSTYFNKKQFSISLLDYCGEYKMFYENAKDKHCLISYN